MRKTIATLLVSLVFLSACASPVVPPTATPTPTPTLTLTPPPTSTPTEIPLPQVYSASQEYETLFVASDPACINIYTTVFNEDVLVHCIYENKSDHFFIDQKDADAVQELNWILLPNELKLHIPLTEGQTAEDAKVIVYWQPNAVDPNGGIVVTYNKTGERGAGEFFVIPQVHEDYVTFRTINLINAPEMPVITQTEIEFKLTRLNPESTDTITLPAFVVDLPEDTDSETRRNVNIDALNQLFTYIVEDNVALGQLKAWLYSSTTSEQREFGNDIFTIEGWDYFNRETGGYMIATPFAGADEKDKFIINISVINNSTANGIVIQYRRNDGFFGAVFTTISGEEVEELVKSGELDFRPKTFGKAFSVVDDYGIEHFIPLLP